LYHIAGRSHCGMWTCGCGNVDLRFWELMLDSNLKKFEEPPIKENTNHTQNMGAKPWPNPQSVSSQRIRVDIQTILNRIFLSYMVPTPQKKPQKKRKNL
jgi:hypothetical protein